MPKEIPVNLPDIAGLHKMTLPERCRAQARSMEYEGWYVCANVLHAAANEIERLTKIEAA